MRRGADRAEIYSLAFSPTAQWLAVSSDKGTAHVFSLKVNSRNGGAERSSSPPGSRSSSTSLSFIKGNTQSICLALSVNIIPLILPCVCNGSWNFQVLLELLVMSINLVCQ